MSISREVLAKYVTKSTVFIETGCRWGDTCIRARELGASPVSSCEVDGLQHAMAWAHINDALPNHTAWFLRQGKSVEFLREYVYIGSEEMVIFLDAHTDTHSPILDELDALIPLKLAAGILRKFTILIDDLRLMSGWGVTLDQIESALYKIGPHTRTFEPGVVPEDILVARYT